MLLIPSESKRLNIATCVDVLGNDNAFADYHTLSQGYMNRFVGDLVSAFGHCSF